MIKKVKIMNRDNSEYEIGENGVKAIEILDMSYPCVKISFDDESTLRISGEYKLFESSKTFLPYFV